MVVYNFKKIETVPTASVRLVGCTSEKPEMALLGKFRKDLWDDDNVQTPLVLNVKNKERGPGQLQANMEKYAALSQ